MRARSGADTFCGRKIDGTSESRGASIPNETGLRPRATLQLTRSQLEHLRRATQLQGAMQIVDDLNTEEFWDSLHFIATELSKRMTNPQFRDEVALIGMADTKVHRELPLMRTLERIGTYVKHGLIDGPIIYDYANPPIERAWELLTGVVRIHRTAHGEAFWENFEMLYREGKRWEAHTRESGFSKQTKR